MSISSPQGRRPSIGRGPCGADRGRTARALLRGGRVLRDRVNGAHLAAGSVSSTRRHVDRSPSVDHRSRRDPSLHCPRGATGVAAGAEIGPHAVVVDAEIGPDALVGPFCYLRPGRRWRREPRPAPSWRSRTPVSERARSATCPYIGDADVGDGTNIGRRERDRELLHRPGPEEAARRSAATSEPASTIRSRLRSRSATTLGFAQERSSLKTSRRERWRASRRGR